MDILGLVKDQLTSGAIEKISGFLGEDSSKTTSALTSAVPTILSGMINKASTTEGAGDLMSLINNGNDGGILSNFSSLLGGGDATTSLLSSGSGILKTIFGDKIGGIADVISKVGGISSNSSSSLLSMAAPLIMGVIGKQVLGSGNGISGLTSLLNSQKDSVNASLPSGLGSLLSISSVVGGIASAITGAAHGVADTAKNVVDDTLDTAKNVVGHTADTAKNVAEGTVNVAKDVVGGTVNVAKDVVGGTVNVAKDVVGGTYDAGKKVIGGAANLAEDAVEAGSSLFRKLLPWLVLALLAFGALVLWKSCQKPAEQAADAAVAVVDSTASKVEDVIKKALPGGMELSFGKESIENEMISFIEDKGKVVDKTTWFNFRNLKFETGSAKIDSTSLQEVKNIAEILKAFPAVKAKIGGYTDNVGNAKSNLKLSDSRAKNVCDAIVALGVDKARLSAEGYGDQHPVASNDTEEGKAQNRRIAVRITEK